MNPKNKKAKRVGIQGTSTTGESFSRQGLDAMEESLTDLTVRYATPLLGKSRREGRREYKGEGFGRGQRMTNV